MEISYALNSTMIYFAKLKSKIFNRIELSFKLKSILTIPTDACTAQSSLDNMHSKTKNTYSFLQSILRKKIKLIFSEKILSLDLSSTNMNHQNSQSLLRQPQQVNFSALNVHNLRPNKESRNNSELPPSGS